MPASVYLLSVVLAADPKPGPTPEELAKKPITTAQGKVGEMLRQWWKEGTAAGNVGDFYDNRDGAHSDLNLGPYPQLQSVHYSDDDVKQRRHWAAARVVRPHVTFGNSSTSAPPNLGGSNPRHYYVSHKGLELLYQQYTKNNLYMYPEHRDHDPGHNGRNDGFGDLYPTNTPYLIISQGSSGSDQPFMRAVPFTLAAFRPEVKKKLVDTGLLMPTVQMILRSTNKHLKAPEEYITGKAHPTVFEGSWVDDVQMVQLAHHIRLETIPPMVQVKVEEEDTAVLGRDFFEAPGATEKLADTSCVIARIMRGKEQKRRMVVSAEGSYDVNKRPLKTTWVVLRGDPQRIRIKPLNDDSTKAEITVSYHERRPIAPNWPMESNRVDIGVFVHNGAYWSAPAFITWFSLDQEARTYDEQGRIIEMGYGVGETRLSVTNWETMLKLAGKDDFAGKVLDLGPAQRAQLTLALPELQRLQGLVQKARQRIKMVDEQRQAAAKQVKFAEEEVAAAAKIKDDAALARTKRTLADTQERLKDAQSAVQDAQKAESAAAKAVTDFLNRKGDGQAQSPRSLVEDGLYRIMGDADFSKNAGRMLDAEFKNMDKTRRAAVETARQRLAAWGLIKKADAEPLEWTPIRKDSWTANERVLLEQYHAMLITQALLPGVVSSSFQINYIDQRLTVPKAWRDVYRYDAKGELLGWTRHTPDGTSAFTADGHLVTKSDERGRCLTARVVQYQAEPLAKNGIWLPLKQVALNEFVEYEYANDKDLKGRIKSKNDK